MIKLDNILPLVLLVALAAAWPFHQVIRDFNLSAGDLVVLAGFLVTLILYLKSSGRTVSEPFPTWAKYMIFVVCLTGYRLIMPSYPGVAGLSLPLVGSTLKLLGGVAWAFTIAVLIGHSPRLNLFVFVQANAVVATWIALIVAYQALVLGEVRPSGTFENPNLCASYFVTNIILLFFLRERGTFLLHEKLIILALVLGVLGTASRTGSLAVFLVMALAHLKTNPIALGKRVLAVSVFLICLAAVAISSESFLQQRLSRGLDEGVDGGRFELWQQAMSAFQAYPFLGVGPGLFVEYHWATGNEVEQMPHNIYLTTLSEAGLVGLFLFLLCYFRMITIVVKRDRAMGGEYLVGSIALAFLIYLVHGLFGNFHYHRSFWIFVGMASFFQAVPNVAAKVFPAKGQVNARSA